MPNPESGPSESEPLPCLSPIQAKLTRRLQQLGSWSQANLSRGGRRTIPQLGLVGSRVSEVHGQGRTLTKRLRQADDVVQQKEAPQKRGGGVQWWKGALAPYIHDELDLFSIPKNPIH